MEKPPRKQEPEFSLVTIGEHGLHDLGVRDVFGKYVVALVRDPSTGEEKTVFWAVESGNMLSHAQLFGHLGRKVTILKCIGGGLVRVWKKERRIEIWDESFEFGSDDKSLTAKMLKKAFPTFSVVIL